MRTAVYAGSFDPPTNGHLWMIEQGLKLFDHLYVAIGSNPAKTYTFSVEERLQMLRNPNDYEYERGMRHINADMAPEIITSFLMPPRDIAELSSSMIKGLIGPDGWEDMVRRYVPEVVFNELEKKC